MTHIDRENENDTHRQRKNESERERERKNERARTDRFSASECPLCPWIGLRLDRTEVVGERTIMEKPSTLMENTSHPSQDPLAALGSSSSDGVWGRDREGPSPWPWSDFTTNAAPNRTQHLRWLIHSCARSRCLIRFNIGYIRIKDKIPKNMAFSHSCLFF